MCGLNLTDQQGKGFFAGFGDEDEVFEGVLATLSEEILQILLGHLADVAIIEHGGPDIIGDILEGLAGQTVKVRVFAGKGITFVIG